MYVATGSSDKTAKLHSAEGEALAVRSFTCDNCEVYCLCFTRDGRHLVVGGKYRLSFAPKSMYMW